MSLMVIKIREIVRTRKVTMVGGFIEKVSFESGDSSERENE